MRNCALKTYLLIDAEGFGDVVRQFVEVIRNVDFSFKRSGFAILPRKLISNPLGHGGSRLQDKDFFTGFCAFDKIVMTSFGFGDVVYNQF